MWYVIASFAALAAVAVYSWLHRSRPARVTHPSPGDVPRETADTGARGRSSGGSATADGRVIRIIGAGPAGLSAAITLALRGVPVLVDEAEGDVGHRFHGDLQGLENWTTEGDVLDELGAMGIEQTFDCSPFTECTFFGPSGRSFVYRSARPLWYLVRRGSGPGTLDRALKARALEAGARIRFGSRVEHLPEGGIVAHGPRRPDAIAAGCIFETDHPDGAYAAMSDELAPGGYAYLLVCGGHGTLATCMFRDFHHERVFADRAVEFFQRRVGLDIRAPRRFGGYGNLYRSPRVEKNGMLFVGEAAGLQDALLGFGMRHAIVSGHLAALALTSGEPADYPRLLHRRLGRILDGGLVNRFLFDHLGDRGYEMLLRRIAASPDPKTWLHHYYTELRWKRVILPLARRRYSARRPLVETCLDGCDCTFCRCDHDRTLPAHAGRR